MMEEPVPDNREANSPKGGDFSPTLWWFAPLGASLMVAGGGLIIIDGLGLSVTVIDRTSARLTAVAVGALLLAAYFLIRHGIEPREGKLLAGGVLLVAGLLSLLVVFEDPRVPDVSGLIDDNAEKILKQLGIHVQGAEAVPDERPSGQVIDQDPKPGDRSDDVFLIVSSGPEIPRLANVLGLDELAAIKVLESLGVEVDRVSVVGSPAGFVADMRPEAPSLAAKVTLWITTGGEWPTMIDWRGSDVTTATSALEDAGIEVIIEQQEASEPNGEIIDQEPDSGVRTVKAILIVSAGPGLPVMPELSNEQRNVAEEKLGGLGISVSIEEESSEVPVKTILRQEPAAGERTTTATLVVSSGPAPDSFTGNWTNLDSESQGLTRLMISGQGQLVMQAFASCSPEDCDWGVVDASVEETALLATFESEFKRTILRVERAGPFLLVEATTEYSDDQTGQDRSDSYVLTERPPEEISVEELEVLRTSPILEELYIVGFAPFVPAATEFVFTPVINLEPSG